MDKEVKHANLNDLERELWIRMRNEGLIAWTTKDGQTIPIKDLTLKHLYNIVKYCMNKQELEDIACDFYASIED